MRTDEIFALKSIAARYSGEWKPGDDPPDGYITFAERVVAVEVSRLTQYVTDDRGTRPRLSDDTAAIRLANELDAELKGAVPVRRRVMLVLSSPIIDYRRTKAELASEISTLIDSNSGSNRVERKISIRGNKIEIYLDESEGNERKKIVAAVMNRSSNPDILANVIYILEDRISTKAQKCGRLSFSGPIWLVLINDYFLTDADTYRHGLKSISVDHPFEKILLVSDNGSVDVLVDTMI
jgi:hypothetical protein